MKNILICLSIITTVFSLDVISANPENLKQGTLKFKYLNKEIKFENAVISIKKIPATESDYQLTLGAEDRVGKQEFILRARLNSFDLSKEHFLELNESSLTIIFKKYRTEGFTLYPAYHLVQAADAKNKKIQKSRPEWLSYSVEKRKKTGKGIIKYSQMQGCSFTLLLIPVIKRKKIIEYLGKFSGLVSSKARNKSKSGFIRSGEFKLGVLK